MPGTLRTNSPEVARRSTFAAELAIKETITATRTNTMAVVRAMLCQSPASVEYRMNICWEVTGGKQLQ